jgi:C-terminal processing protease CtpA/Prc
MCCAQPQTASTTADHFRHDVDFLEQVVERWWANVEIHVQQDGVHPRAVFGKLRERALVSESVWQFAVALREELCGLKDGHLRLGRSIYGVERFFSSAARFAQVQDGIAFVGMPDDLGDRGDSLARGDLLIDVDGQHVQNYLRDVRLVPGSTERSRLHAAIQSLSWQELLPDELPRLKQLTVQDASGHIRQVFLHWSEAPGPGPTPNAVLGRVLTEDVGLLEIRTFHCRDDLGIVSDVEFSRQFQAAMDRIGAVMELIVDVRGNQGGRDEQARLAADRLAPHPLTWARYRHKTPAGMSPQYDMAEDRLDIQSPASTSRARLWFLAGPGTMSTAEIFLAALRSQTDSRVIGESTAGSVGNPQPFRLPNSGLPVLIPISQFALPHPPYSLIEGRGLAPDVACVPTSSDVRAGRDPVLEAALAAIRGTAK